MRRNSTVVVRFLQLGALLLVACLGTGLSAKAQTFTDNTVSIAVSLPDKHGKLVSVARVIKGPEPAVALLVTQPKGSRNCFGMLRLTEKQVLFKPMHFEKGCEAQPFEVPIERTNFDIREKWGAVRITVNVDNQAYTFRWTEYENVKDRQECVKFLEEARTNFHGLVERIGAITTSAADPTLDPTQP